MTGALPPKYRALAAAFACSLAAQAAFALDAAPRPAPPAGAAAAAGEPMVVAIRLNTQAKGEFFVIRAPGGDFLVRTVDLIAMGFTAPTGTTLMVDGEPHISLRSIGGLALVFNEKTLVLDITADPHLMPTNALDLGSRRRKPPPEVQGPSAFFNYSFQRQHAASANDTSFTGEVGARAFGSLLTTDAQTITTTDGRRRLVRMMSTFTRDDVAGLRRYTAGDFIATSGELGSGATLGGIGLSKLFTLDPYFNRYPTHTLTGVAALPSEVDIYVDGQRVRTERVQPGGFELRNLTGYGGSRSVQVVLRDPFGRTQELDYPLYFSDQPLQQGLHEYSYGLGAMRRNLGLRSADYGPAAFAFFHRYGLSEGLTIGWRGEGTRQLLNGGPMLTAILGNAGVVNFVLAGSSIAGRRGHAASLSYNYDNARWHAGVALRHETRRYATLGDPPTVSGRRWDAGVSLSYTFPRAGAVSLSHSVTLGRGAGLPATASRPFVVNSVGDRRDTTLAYSLPLASARANLIATASRVKGDGGWHNEAFVGLQWNLDPTHRLNANVQQLQDSRISSLQYTQQQPLGEGLGYDVTASHVQSSSGLRLQLATSMQYNAPAAVLRADYGHLRGDEGGTTSSQNRLNVSVAGGVAWVGGRVALGRPIGDGFAMVRTNPLGGVPVMLNGQPMGKTGADGSLLLPALSAYSDNQIAIAPENLPLEYSFNATQRRVAPPARSGVVVDFHVQRVQGFVGRLVNGPRDAPTPLELQQLTLTGAATSLTLPVGQRGEFYAENLAPGRYEARASAHPGAPVCTGTLVVPASEDPLVELGDLYCASAGGAAR